MTYVLLTVFTAIAVSSWFAFESWWDRVSVSLLVGLLVVLMVIL